MANVHIYLPLSHRNTRTLPTLIENLNLIKIILNKSYIIIINYSQRTVKEHKQINEYAKVIKTKPKTPIKTNFSPATIASLGFFPKKVLQLFFVNRSQNNNKKCVPNPSHSYNHDRLLHTQEKKVTKVTVIRNVSWDSTTIE